MKTSLQTIWLARTWKARILWPASILYGLLAGLRRLFYRAGLFKSFHAGVPTVVIGNVVAGGGGKTPLILALLKHLQQLGIHTGVVTRGYGRTSTATVEVFENTPVNESGDEPALIRRTSGAPVFVASKRIDGARALLAAYPETQVLLCDDGLQHYALQRDIEVVVFDDRGVGNGWLLPAGPLRESWPARLTKTDLVLHTGQQPAFAGFRSSRNLHTHGFAADGTAVALADLQNQDVVALAGIANPEAFFLMLKSRGLQLEKTISLPDHDDFSGFDLNCCSGKVVLCTEKDAVKLFQRASDPSITLLAVPLAFAPEPAFFTAFDKLLLPLLIPIFSQLPLTNGYQTT